VSCTVRDFSDLSDEAYGELSEVQQDFGCQTWANQPGQPFDTVAAVCTVAPNVVCAGNRTFSVDNVACIKYAHTNTRERERERVWVSGGLPWRM
jgi:hypothetical protein